MLTTSDSIPTRPRGLLAASGVLALSLLLAACSPENANTASQVRAPTAASGRENSQHLYVVYCNGTVDHLDLAKQAKVASFQLSDRSGSPPAVAKLPAAGVRPDSCLARPASLTDALPQDEGMAFIVASAQLQRDDTSGRMPHSLLKFSVPAWTLQSRQDLGSFDVLNGTPPRITRGSDGRLKPQPAEIDPTSELRAELSHYAGGATVTFATPLATSANTALIGYTASQNAHGAAYALMHRTQRSIVRIEGVPGSDPEPALTLAPGGQFVLHSVRAFSSKQGSRQLAATGELRLYGADGKLVSQQTDERVAGEWYPIALTPQGVAVYTDRRGTYRFVTLGRMFGVEPVQDPNTDDLDGARPGVIYAGG